MLSTRRLAPLWLCLAIASFVSSAGAAETDSVRDAMREIEMNLRLVLQEAVAQRSQPKAKAWTDHAAVRRTGEALRAISDQAALISGHAHPTDELSSFLAASVDRMASLTALSYDSREWLRWQTYLFRMTDLCVTCHSRRPAAGAPTGADLVDPETLKPLPRSVQAEIETATRRFDAAFASWRAVVDERLAVLQVRPQSDVDTDAADQLVRPLGHALVIALRVRQDFDAAFRLVTSLSREIAFPGYLRPMLGEWALAIQALRGSQLVGPDEAERLISRGDAMDRNIPASGLVHHIVASGSLYRNLEVRSLRKRQRAQVLYQLALAEHRIQTAANAPGETPWFPETELLLELAIIADPGSSTASSAYKMLERLVNAAFPIGLPDEVAAHLRALGQHSGS